MRYSLKVPQFQIFLGGVDISKAIVGYSFSHPLSEISTPLIWTGSIEMFPARSDQPRSFFDDEINPSRWLSGLQPIDVYFNGTWWQRFRIKPSGYRFNQDNGQAEIEITDIIGILDSYQPSADAPEFKTGQDNRWNDLAVKLIRKQASLMGISVSVQTPSYGIGGIYRVPRSISGSYIKEAQKMAGERGQWFWSDKETIKCIEYPLAAQNIVWSKSRRELHTFTRQQGLDPVKQQITVSATHEDIDTCKDQYPQTTHTFASAKLGGFGNNLNNQSYYQATSTTEKNKNINGNCIYIFTTKTLGNPMFIMFGAQIQLDYSITGQAPNVAGAKNKRLDEIKDPNTGRITYQGSSFDYQYDNQGIDRNASFNFRWTGSQNLLFEEDKTTYENVPFDAQNASKIISKVVTRAEPWAKFPEALQYYNPNLWFNVPTDNSFLSDSSSLITEKTTTTYTYVEIFRDDIIVIRGQRLYEISEITELKEQTYFYVEKFGNTNQYKRIIGGLVAQELTRTTYKKECQGRWLERKEISQNKGQSSTNVGYLFGVQATEDPVYSIPEITYRPPPYPVFQRPLLATVQTGYAGISPFVNSSQFITATTLTTKAECERLARYEGQKIWQRYYGREIACGYGTTLDYVPFQGVLAGNGAYIRDRFGISLNQDSNEWQFVEACIGNKTGTIAEIAPPPLAYPPVFLSSLAIGSISDQTVRKDQLVSITLAAAGGIAPYRFVCDNLPSGLFIQDYTLNGRPQNVGTVSVTIKVYDSTFASKSSTFSLTVVAPNPTPLSTTNPSVPAPTNTLNIGASSDLNFVQGIAIASTIFNSSGGQTPYTYSSTALSTGLTLSSSGVLTGIPTATAATSVTVTVTDSLGATNSTIFNIVVAAAIVPISIVSGTIAIAMELNEIYSLSILGGISIPIVGIYKDLTVFSFAVSIAGASNLVIPAIALSAFVGNVKPANSDLAIPAIALSALASNIKPANSNLAISAINFNAIASNPPAPPPAATLKAYWSFDDTSNTSDSYDSSNSYRFGSFCGGTSFTTGKINSAIVVGNQAYLQNADGSQVSNSIWNLSITNFIGMAAWIKWTTLTNQESAILFDGNNPYNYWIGVDSSSQPKLFVTDASSNTITLTLPVNLSTDTWYLFGFEINKNTGDLKLRMDDLTPVSDSNSFTCANSFAQIKIQKTNSDHVIDELKFYGSALSESEWATLYNNGNG